MNITRREFAKVGLVALGGMAVGPDLDASVPDALPTVRWANHEISRLLLGHNPLKGIAHQAGDLGREMREYFESVPGRGRDLMRRCEELGITTFQLGFRPTERFVEDMIRDRRAEGGRFQWIATFYSLPQDREAAEQELRYLLQMNSPPIGVQQVGNTSDLLMRQGKLDLSLDNLKRFRDAGLLVGLGSHNPEVIDCVESKGWDLDFYQCCFYRSLFGLNARPGSGESFEPADRDAMTRVIRRVSKPCIAFKVLAAGRHCQTPATLEAALRFAFQNIKPTDVVLLGMWQKHKDQAGENIALARKILGNDQPARPKNLPGGTPSSARS
jgi:hypothetical protein